MNESKRKDRRVRVTEAMVRRFCEANQREQHGSGCDCDGEYHQGIRAGLEAVLNGTGPLCSPRFCKCDAPKPDRSYHNRCKANVDSPYNGGICYGFIRGVSEYYDRNGRSTTFGRKRKKPRDGDK